MATTLTSFCDPTELAALSAMFKGNATAAGAFCQKLAILGSPDGTSTPGLQQRIEGIEEGVNTFFMTVMGSLVFIMHAGFAMVRDKHHHLCCLEHLCHGSILQQKLESLPLSVPWHISPHLPQCFRDL